MAEYHHWLRRRCLVTVNEKSTEKRQRPYSTKEIEVTVAPSTEVTASPILS